MPYKNIKNPVKGYKVFKLENGKLDCRGFKFGTKKEVVGKVFKNVRNGCDIPPMLCNTGFHFCKKLNHCFNYYGNVPMDLKGYVICEVEGHRQITTDSGDKVATSELKITKILTTKEVKALMRPKNAKVGLISETTKEYSIFTHYSYWSNRSEYRINIDGWHYVVPRAMHVKKISVLWLQ